MFLAMSSRFIGSINVIYTIFQKALTRNSHLAFVNLYRMLFVTRKKIEWREIKLHDRIEWWIFWRCIDRVAELYIQLKCMLLFNRQHQHTNTMEGY